MKKFKASEFIQNIRVCLSSKEVNVPKKKFTIKRELTYDNSNYMFVFVSFALFGSIAAILMVISIIVKFNNRNAPILDDLTSTTFILCCITFILSFFNKRVRTMYWWNIGIWGFNVIIWGLDTFNIWIYGQH